MARKTLTTAARQRLAAIVERYKTEVHAPKVSTNIDATELELAAVSLCREELEHARDMFNAFRWQDSRAQYVKARNAAERILATGANASEVQSVIVSAVLGEVASLLNLQDSDTAAARLKEIDGRPLDTRQRSGLARALVELDQLDNARVILDAVPASERDDTRWREASQLVDLASNKLPEIIDREPSVLYKLSSYHLRVGEAGKAAATALDGLSSGDKNPVLGASLLGNAMVALMRTLYEDDLRDEGVPQSQRAPLAREIAAKYRQLFTSALPESVKLNLLAIGLNYAGSLRERELLRWIIANSDEAARDRVETNAIKVAFDLASQGDLERALEVAPQQDHQWRNELLRCQLKRAAGDVDGAVEGLSTLATLWPGRVPIHMALAELLIEGREFDAAVAHAEASHRALATDSMCTLFARCLVETRQGARALEVLESVPTTELVLELRGYAADTAHDPRAPSYWAQLLDYDANDTRARLHLAAAHSRLGDVEGAARHARELLETHVDSLKRDEIAACGQMLSLARFLPTSDKLIRLAADTLKARFPSDDTAEFQRLMLVSCLGFPEGSAPIDYERLSRSGHLQSMSIDEVAALMKHRSVLCEAAHKLYRDGWLSLNTLCDVTGIRAASLLASWSQDTSGTPLRAAIVPSISSSEEMVSGRKYLCTALELLLLQNCGALVHVPAAIGSGALVATESTWSRMLEDAFYLEQSSQRAEAGTLSSLLSKIATSSKITRIEHGDEQERALAARLGYPFVGLSGADRDEALAVLQTIAADGGIPRAQLARATHHLGNEPIDPSRRINLETPLFFEAGLLELLETTGVLDAVLLSTTRIVISDLSIASLQRRVEELEHQGQAASLQGSAVQLLGEGLSAGWFRLIKDPRSSLLPDFRDGVDRDEAELLTRSIRDLVAYREVVNNTVDMRRLVADSFGFDTLGHPHQWRMLAFHNEREGRAFVRRYWKPNKHEVTFGRFVRAFVSGSQRGAVVRSVARLGFTDAFRPDDLVQLVAEFGRLDVGGAARILDGLEASASDSHTRGVFSRAQIAGVYPMAMWRLARDGHNAAPAPESVYRQLLSRLERIDERSATRLVEQTLCSVALAALDDREASFVEGTEGMFNLVPESVAGRLWKDLAIWEEANPRRQASFRRGIAHAWEVLGDLQDGPVSSAQWAPLALANDILIHADVMGADVPSPDAVVAVMSALWKERPLSRKSITFTSEKETVQVDLEQLMSFAARSARANDKPRWASDGTSLTFEYAPKAGGGVEVSVPVEAVLLRMPNEAAAKFARELATGNGVRDGRLYRALIEFANRPDDKARRKHLARAACGSPFRLVADDPRLLLCFGDRSAASQKGYPATIDELRELLSEPDQLFSGPMSGIAEQELVEEFRRRFADDGCWGKRLDRRDLLHFGSRIPGRLPAMAARSMFEQESEEDLQEVVAALEQSLAMPVGTLAMATAFSIFTCLSDRPAALKDKMSDALAGVLRGEFAPQSERSLAGVEPTVLHAVAAVVSRLAPSGLLTVEHAWLTTRLYEWWMREGQTSEVCTLFDTDPTAKWHRLRTEVALNVLLDVLELKVITEKQPLSIPETVMQALKDIVAGDADNPFESARRPNGWLYWKRPQGCGWLAASILLWASPGSFFDMRPEMRLALLEKLPRTKADADANGLSYQPVIHALGRSASRLTQPELDALEAWLVKAESSGLIDLWRADLLSGLVASRGDRAAAAKLRALATSETLRTSLSEVVASYVDAIAFARLSDMEDTVVELLDVVSKLEHGTAAIVRGLRLALGRASAEAVRALLSDVARIAAEGGLVVHATITEALANEV